MPTDSIPDSITDSIQVIAPINSPGMLDRRVLHQDRWWFDRLGRAHLIDEMPPAYRHNLYRFLWCHRRRLHAWDSLSTPLAEHLLELEQVLAAGRRGCLPHQLDADTWFAGLPLVARLHQLVGGLPASFTDGNPGQEVTERDATREYRDRATLLENAWPALQHLLAAQGATPDQQSELHGHVVAASRSVLDA